MYHGESQSLSPNEPSHQRLAAETRENLKLSRLAIWGLGFGVRGFTNHSGAQQLRLSPT